MGKSGMIFCGRRKNRSKKKRESCKKEKHNKCNKKGGCEKNKSKKCKKKAYVFIDSCAKKSIYEKYSDNINKKLPTLLVAKTLDETSLLHDNYLHNDVFLTIMYYLKNPDYELLECAENGFN